MGQPASLGILPFGSTGHDSTRLIFGAAALWRADEATGRHALGLLLEYGVNHIDVAASYGDAELRVGEWMGEHRDRFFLATKTDRRDYEGARAQIRRSLERLHTDRLDLLQFHNLVDAEEQRLALGADGALRAALEAREEGLVRFLGVTGHGTRVARSHLDSLSRYPFDSVLLPYNIAMMRDARYAEDFEALAALCAERGVAVQTIKSVARGRWPEDAPRTHDTWYEPLADSDDIALAVHWALARPGIFVNTAGDLEILPKMLAAAAAPPPVRPRGDGGVDELELQPLFVRGYRA